MFGSVCLCGDGIVHTVVVELAMTVGCFVLSLSLSICVWWCLDLCCCGGAGGVMVLEQLLWSWRVAALGTVVLGSFVRVCVCLGWCLRRCSVMCVALFIVWDCIAWMLVALSADDAPSIST